MTKTRKIAITLITLLMILSLMFFLVLKFGLVNDNRGDIAKELFIKKDGAFDYDLLDKRINERFSAKNFSEVRLFVEKLGGICQKQNVCKLYIYATICISEMAILTPNQDGSISVKPYVDGC